LQHGLAAATLGALTQTSALARFRSRSAPTESPAGALTTEALLPPTTPVQASVETPTEQSPARSSLCPARSGRGRRLIHSHAHRLDLRPRQPAVTHSPPPIAGFISPLPTFRQGEYT